MEQGNKTPIQIEATMHWNVIRLFDIQIVVAIKWNLLITFLNYFHGHWITYLNSGSAHARNKKSNPIEPENAKATSLQND